jgi:3-oxoadipate enol-lactonase
MRARHASVEPLLLIAGLGQGTWVWRDVLSALERDRPVIVFEARGTGNRAHLPARPSIGEMVADVLAELVQPAHVLGFSMGGYVALTLALTEPERVRSLLLFATGGGGPGRVPRPRYVADATAEALGLPDPEFAERTMPFTFAPGWAEASPERFNEIISARIEHPTPYDLLEAHAAACFGFYEGECEVERIRAPTLVVHGDQDLIVPVENGRLLAARLQRGEYVELPGRGHNLMLEDPESFTRLVLEFLGGAAARLTNEVG